MYYQSSCKRDSLDREWLNGEKKWNKKITKKLIQICSFFIVFIVDPTLYVQFKRDWCLLAQLLLELLLLSDW